MTNGKNGNGRFPGRPHNCDNIPGDPACIDCYRKNPKRICAGCDYRGLNKKKVLRKIEELRGI